VVGRREPLSRAKSAKAAKGLGRSVEADATDRT